ncbi:TRAP transporter small permease [Pikeienuella piscinae]|nr:TRAP transporter small permease [Pikeienuella piscinae]
MNDATVHRRRAGFAGAVERLIHAWALLGGALLLLVVLMNVVSVVGAAIWVPFPGDFEMTEVGVAVAAFAFLPYCQLTDSNVTADIFTAGASRRWIARFRLLASVVALLFGALLLWRMFAGMESQREYGYTTTILQLPIWLAFIPILISLALLVAAALISINDAGRAARADG